MSRQLQPSRLNMQAFAEEGETLQQGILLKDLPRVSEEIDGDPLDSSLAWKAHGELRPHPGSEDQVWLHLHASANIPLTCQRCMGVVVTPVEIDQWYRFVGTEEIAMAEDDDAEEDLLVMAPQMDLIALIEDELLMALPLVPMHETCPNALAPLPEVPDPTFGGTGEKPNPFAVLAQLKTKSGD